MTGLSKVWLVVAVLFTLGNLVFAGIAAAWREPLHAAVHLVLALLGAYPVWRLAPKRFARRDPRQGRAESPAVPSVLTDRLTHLEQSVDAVAVEVERIGEGQRFMTRVFAETGTSQAPATGVAEAIEIEARETPEARRS